MAVSAATLAAEILAEMNSQFMGTGVLSAEITGTVAANGTLTTKVKPKIGSMPIDAGLAKAISTAVANAVSKYL